MPPTGGAQNEKQATACFSICCQSKTLDLAELVFGVVWYCALDEGTTKDDPDDHEAEVLGKDGWQGVCDIASTILQIVALHPVADDWGWPPGQPESHVWAALPRPRGTVIRIGHHIADCPPHWSANDENGGSQGVRVPASFTAASSRDGDGKEEFFLRKMKTMNGLSGQASSNALCGGT